MVRSTIEDRLKRLLARHRAEQTIGIQRKAFATQQLAERRSTRQQTARRKRIVKMANAHLGRAAARRLASYFETAY